MNQEHIIQVLGQTDLFAEVDRQALAEVAASAYYKTLAKGEFLIHEQDPANEIYIVTKGAFSVSKKSDLNENAVQAHFSLLKPFATVGELSLLDDMPRSADVIAQEDCEVLAIPYEQLKKTAPAAFYKKISKQLSHNIRTGNETIIQKLRREVEQNKKLANMGRFITYVLFLMAFYDLALKGFIALATNPYTAMFASTSVIFVFTLVMTLLVWHMGGKLKDYGVNLRNWKTASLESLFYTSIFLAVLTAIKWLYAYEKSIPFIDLQALVPFAKLGSVEFIFWYSMGVLVYATFSIFQEFVTRGVLQTSLSHFLQNKHKEMTAIIITAVIFSAMHIHLSAVLAYVVFIPGVFWGWLYSRHRTLISPIISHVLIGVWAVFVLGIQGLLS